MTPYRIGLIINPVAGVGGPLGWHGSDMPRWKATDGPAPARAARALAVLSESLADGDLLVLTAAGSMGGDAVANSTIPFLIVYEPPDAATTPQDTARAAAAVRAAGVDLIVFVGGDGTARDICSAIGQTVPTIGIPAGVKMHSGAFGHTPEAAARAMVTYLAGQTPAVPTDVVDLDEDARERGNLTTRLFGQLLVPRSVDVQRGKVTVRGGEDDVAGIAREVRERLKPGYGVVLGPGTTIQAVGGALGWQLSLLGVDAVVAGRVERDVSAAELRRALGESRFQVIVSPIGGQGMVIGRGNQPIDGDLLRRLDPDDLIIVCSPKKLATLRGELYLDAPEPDLNRRFTGVRRVITGYRQEAAVMVR